MRGSLLFVFFSIPFSIFNLSLLRVVPRSMTNNKSKMENVRYPLFGAFVRRYFFSPAGLTVTLIFTLLECSVSVADSSNS